MPKTSQKRYQDALDYINAHVSVELGTHIDQLLSKSAGDVAAVYDGAIGAEMSLSGMKSWYYARSEGKRQALRALLLCQNVYLSDRWYRASAVGGSWAAQDRRPAGMLKTSMEYWRQQSELEIREAIRTFVITNNGDLSRLVEAARHPGDDGKQLPTLDLSRTQAPFPGHPTCYTSVTHWLLRSGLVSYRWMLRHGCGSLAPIQLAEVFGPADTIWAANKTFGPNDRLPAVAPGMIVHLYINQPYSVGGHWLVSAGNGKAYGRNNDDEDGRANRVFALCDLNRQFAAYKETMPGKSGGMLVQQGQADVIDPAEIPDLI